MKMEKSELPDPKIIHRISNTDMLMGLAVPPIKRLQQIDEDTYEEIILCWAKGHLANEYETTMQLGGAGDKGRDVCGFRDFKKEIFDLYQCKHYSKKLTYSAVRLEFAKLLFYTFYNHYNIPQKYYFVSPQGISSTLLDLIKNPDKLKASLISDWDSMIKGEITKKDDDSLTPELSVYINDFDFSIIYSLEPIDFIEQFQKTTYYPYYFGGGLNKRRNTKIKLTDDIEESEINYVNQLYEAYADYQKIRIETVNDFEDNQELKSHFDRSRNCFYMAETLSQFSRDNIPSEIDAFEELKDEVFEQVIDICNKKHEHGYDRLNATTESAKNGSYYSNPLFPELKAQDKTGICHHLANEYKLKWVK